MPRTDSSSDPPSSMARSAAASRAAAVRSSCSRGRPMPFRIIAQRCYDTLLRNERQEDPMHEASERRRPDWGLGRYEATAARLEPAARAVVTRAAPAAGEHVLDLGCGTGNAAFSPPSPAPG